jgi:HSP20 family protein
MALMRNFNNQLPTINNVFDDFFGGDIFAIPFFNSTSSVPSVNVKKTQDEYNIEVAAPGLNKNDFKVEVHNNVLNISYEKKDKHEDKENGYTRQEFCYSNFKRSFAIPRNEVDESKIDASYKDGILKITLHKREEVKPKPAKMIEIK